MRIEYGVVPRRRRKLDPVATLWQLVWNEDLLSCAVYRAGKRGLEMRLEAGTRTLFCEPFELGPRMVARAQALRRSLMRRGWRELEST
jgi:hypothetical protein